MPDALQASTPQTNPTHPARNMAPRRYRMPASARRLSGQLTLWTGQTVYVRPIRPSDAARLRDFHTGLSKTSIVFRFFTYVPALPPQELNRLTHVDYLDRMALVALGGTLPTDPLIAVGRYDRIGSQLAEVAFAVTDTWQRHGLGMALLMLLAEYARSQGITTLLAYVLEENAHMMEVFENTGFPLRSTYSAGEIEVEIDIISPPIVPLARIAFTADSAFHRQTRSPV